MTDGTVLWGSSRHFGVNDSSLGVFSCTQGKLGGLLAMQNIDDLRDFFFGDDEDDTEPIASAGNGGTATSSANGGAVAIGDINSGENSGNAIGVGDTVGSVAVDGGAVANATTLNVSANGGTAISDASGGDYNIAFLS
jgi:hypothetical protein